MKPKGKKAWLITWEGEHSEFNGRCKIVSILRPQIISETIKRILPILFSSDYNLTLGEKMSLLSSKGKDPWFREEYSTGNVQLGYGASSYEYLRARQVKNLRCMDNKKDSSEATLFWTELHKFILNTDYGLEGPPIGEGPRLKQVCGEKDCSYTYSIRLGIDNAIARKAKSFSSDKDQISSGISAP